MSKLIGQFIGLHGKCAHCGRVVSGVRVWCEACLKQAARLRGKASK